MPINQQDREKLIALAERCEAGTGPDRVLDVLIEIECGDDGPAIAKIMAGSPHNTIDAIATYAARSESHVFFRVPAYTASLDAAMTLVPEGANVTTQNFGGPGPMALVEPNERFTSAATLLLALCAAALRARATIQERNDG